MHSNNSGLGNGCGTSSQTSLEEMTQQNIAKEIEKQIELDEQQYIEQILPQSSPINIPSNAIIKDEQKIAGYRQIKYQWKNGEYKYISRWHERTPNAPENQGNSWVVERVKIGIGNGPNARAKVEEILVGKNSDGSNIWLSKKEWNLAILARKNGTATKEQKEILNNGHWKA